MNKVILMGNLTKDIIVRTTPTGKKVASFSIATNESYLVGGEKKQETTFHNIIIWGERAVAVEKYFSKGDKILLEGRLSNRSYQDKAGITKYISEVIVNHFEFTGKPITKIATPPEPTPEPIPEPMGEDTKETTPVLKEQTNQEINIDDIPF